MQIEKDKLVLIDYTLKAENGDVLDSSIGGNPLPYVHGAGEIIVGLEKALEGRKKGDKFNISIPPNEGYGQYQDGLIQEAPKKEFSEIKDLEVGTQFEVEIDTDAGPQATIAKVLKIENEVVQYDMNHPLAGKELNFEIEVKDVREQTPEQEDIQLDHPG